MKEVFLIDGRLIMQRPLQPSLILHTIQSGRPKTADTLVQVSGSTVALILLDISSLSPKIPQASSIGDVIAPLKRHRVHA